MVMLYASFKNKVPRLSEMISVIFQIQMNAFYALHGNEELLNSVRYEFTNVLQIFLVLKIFAVLNSESPWRAEFSVHWLICRLGGVWFSYQPAQLNVFRICLGAAGWQLTLLLAPPRFNMTSPGEVHLSAQGS